MLFFIKRVFRKLKKIFFKIIAAFFGIVPVKKYLWLFGAWGGAVYADNSKYLFEYITKEHPEINAVWFTRSNKVFEQLSSDGIKCCKPNSLKGIYFAMRAECAFETEGEWDISELINTKHTSVIQLWHGMGVKSMKWQDDKKLQKLNKRFLPYSWASPSELYTDIISKLLSVNPEKFSITGYPRNDTFVSLPHNGYMEKLKEGNPDSKFIIYMPTHRNFGAEGNKHINIDALREVDKKLCEENLIMVYKPHIHELKNFLQYENDFKNIILAKEQDIWADVYSYLHCFDALITDYSSVASDFMCSGKPVVYFTYDLDEYINGDAGLNDYFWEIPGGPMCSTWEETINQTAALLNNDTFKDEREKCRKQYHFYNDGNNCRRVYEYAEKLLKS